MVPYPNMRMTSFQNIIECVYGVLKARFPVLKMMTSFSLVTQMNIIIACFALHNFIRKEGLGDEFFTQYNQLNKSFQNSHMCVDDDEGLKGVVPYHNIPLGTYCPITR